MHSGWRKIRKFVEVAVGVAPSPPLPRLFGAKYTYIHSCMLLTPREKVRCNDPFTCLRVCNSFRRQFSSSFKVFFLKNYWKSDKSPLFSGFRNRDYVLRHLPLSLSSNAYSILHCEPSANFPPAQFDPLSHSLFVLMDLFAA